MPAPTFAKFSTKIFDTAEDLKAFLTTDTTVASIVSVVCDASGKYVLFYMTT